MTIGSTVIQTSGSPGNGATVQFSFSFSVESYGGVSQAEQITVIRETIATGAEEVLTLTTHYTTSFNGDQSSTPGGSITMVSAPTSAQKIWIRLNPSFVQATDLQSQGGFQMETVEDQWDQHTRQILALKDMTRRAPRVGIQAGTSFDGEITGDLTAGYVPIVNGALDGWTLGTPVAGGTVSAAMAPVVASATIDAAMELLDQGDFTATGATAARNLADRFSEVLWPEDFGAVGDGTTDDLTPLTNWLNAVMASASRRGFMRPKVYAISGALPQINIPGVQIIGIGPRSSHDAGAAGAITDIKAITNSGFTMMTVAPTEGAGNQRLDGNKILGIAFNGNSLAAKGLLIKSVHHGEFDVFVRELTTSGVETDVCATLAEAADTQRNTFRIAGRQFLNTAPAVRLKGSASANTSLNRFERVNIAHNDGSAVIVEGADNNLWDDLSLFCAGSATNSIEWHGAAAAGQHVRAEHILNLSCTKPAIVKGLATYAAPASGIVIELLDIENGSPEPTVEAGATARWGTSRSPESPQAPGYNLVINGDFALNQLAPATNADKTAGFDGGVVLTQTDTVALSSQSSPGAGQAQCLRMTQSQAVAQRMGYLFVIPSEDTIPLREKGVALAALIRLSATADVRCAILEWTGTADAVAGDIVADWTSATYTTAGFFESTTKNVLAVMETPATAATWRELSGLLDFGGLTATVGASANNLLVFIWTEGTVAQNVTLDIGRVRVLSGYMPDRYFPAENRADLIERAQRQVFKTYNIATAPGTSTVTGAVHHNSQGNAQASRWWCPFRTRMRTTPTVTVYSQTGAAGSVRDVSAGADIAADDTGAGEDGVAIFPTANTTAINIITFHVVATAYPWT